MKRRVIKQSGRAFTVTLPIRWVRERKIKEGDEIDLSILGNDLVISAEGSKKNIREAHIDIAPGRESSIRTLIVNAYRSGFDKISVRYEGEKRDINRIVEKFMIGFELFEHGNYYSIDAVSEPSAENVENIISRLFYTLNEIIRNFPNSIDEDVYKIQRYDNFLKRCISKGAIVGHGMPSLWQFLSNLVQIARLFYHFRRAIHKDQYDADARQILSKLTEMLEILKKGYQKLDVANLRQLHTIDSEIYDMGILKMSKSPLFWHYVLMISRMIYLANSPLTGYLHANKFS